ncbi:hypothetical protein [Terricaulis sp.]|uniref:hypothetical protein n=1 Tax=Terricaulis sp. TaxID=2768686 RepID=UPI00378501E3
MGVCESLAPSGAAPLTDLAGVELQHDLHLAIRDWTAWSAISDRLSAAGADIYALQLFRGAGGFNVRCRLERVSDVVARTLIDTLLRDGIVERGDVEHLLLATRDAGEGA